MSGDGTRTMSVVYQDGVRMVMEAHPCGWAYALRSIGYEDRPSTRGRRSEPLEVKVDASAVTPAARRKFLESLAHAIVAGVLAEKGGAA